MEMHFYEAWKALASHVADDDLCLDWERTKKKIERKVQRIHTMQMCMLSTTLLMDGYCVFVHQGNGITYELTLRSETNAGDRAVRPGQNLYAMWAGNIFRE